MSALLAPCAALLAATLGVASAKDLECPAGTYRVLTDNPYEPFRCVEKGREGKGLKSVMGPLGFKVKPKCPRGARPLMTPDGIQSYRCVVSSSASSEPDLVIDHDDGRPRSRAVVAADAAPEVERCPPGSKRIRTIDPDEPFRCVEASARERAALQSYQRYSIPGELSFEYPKGWHLTDAWTDVPHSVFVVHDTGRGGKQVTMTVTLYERGQSGYQEMNMAMFREKEWQGASDDGKGSVGGLPALFIRVPKSSRTAYVASGEDRYFVLNYSSPADVYEANLPAFERLLQRFNAGAR